MQIVLLAVSTAPKTRAGRRRSAGCVRYPSSRAPGRVWLASGDPSPIIGLRMRNLGHMTRRDVLTAATAATLGMLLRASAPRSAAAADFDVNEKSLNELQTALASGQVT